MHGGRGGGGGGVLPVSSILGKADIWPFVFFK